MDDLVTLYADEVVADWYAGTWTHAEASRNATAMAAAWLADGVSKWMAYERATGALVGRGGLSRIAPDSPVVDPIAERLPGSSWRDDRIELGWALLAAGRGHGYATEIGRAGLRFAFDELGSREVVAFTERHNAASRAVMERIGMKYAGEFLGTGLVEGHAGVHGDAPFAVYSARP